MDKQLIQDFYSGDAEFLFQFAQQEDNVKLNSDRQKVCNEKSTSIKKKRNKNKLTSWERNEVYNTNRIHNIMPYLPDFTLIDEDNNYSSECAWSRYCTRNTNIVSHTTTVNYLNVYLNTDTRKVTVIPYTPYDTKTKKTLKKAANRKLRNMPLYKTIGNYRKYYDIWNIID